MTRLRRAGRPVPPTMYLAGAVAALVAALAALLWDEAGVASRGLLLAAGVAAGALLVTVHRSRVRPPELGDPFEDHVTGLPSGRFARAFLETQIGAARRGHTLSVALFALDGFEGLADQARGRLLERMGRVFRENVREMNVVGHLREGRFLAVLPNEARSGTSVFADRVLAGVEELGPVDGHAASASAGVAGFSREVTGAEELLARAREALRRAAELGGGHVVLHGEDAYRVGPVQPHFSPRESAEARPAGPEDLDAPGGTLRNDDRGTP